ncbi:MAG: DoxX family protein [Planctomycetota bacterium]|nr:DoxX family protein [Planctomycetota bacterium]
MKLSQTQNRIAWAAQILSAIILGQTLFFKFTAAPEAVALFTKLGVEPFGRIGLGVVELIAVILLLVPRTAAMGSALTLGLMVGAIGSHLTKLGIEVEGDGGALFTMAVIAFITGFVGTWIRRRELPILGAKFGAPTLDS